MPPMPPMLILLFLSQNTHLTRTGAAARRSHLLTSIAPHSLFVALALALIAEQRQVGSMRQNAPVDVGAVPAQMNALLMRLELTQRACVVTGATQCHREQPTLR